MPAPEQTPPESGGPQQEPSLAQTAASVAAAMFGVQNARNRERDFKSKSPARFIFMGAVMTCVFITIVLFAVRCSLQQAGMPP